MQTLNNLHNSAEQLVSPSPNMVVNAPKNPVQFSSFTNNYSSLIDKQSSSGRNVSPVTSTSIHPESTVLSLNNNPCGGLTVE